MSTRLLIGVASLSLVILACSNSTKASTGRTERETDSVIGQSAVPGATGVQKALDAQDSARARVAGIDSVGTAQ